MSLYRRKKNGKEVGTYWMDITIPNGKRVRISTKTENRKEALEYHDKLKRELWQQSKLGKKPRRTWKEAVLRWCNEKQYKKSLNKDIFHIKWLNPYFGDLYLDEIKRDQIDAVKHQRLQEGVLPSTTNRTLAFIRGVLRIACEEWEWLDKAPMIRLYKENNQTEYWLTNEEVDRLLYELPPHLKDIAEFALATGLRSSNLTQLKWKQIDFDKRVLIVPAAQSKSAKPITVPLIPEAIVVLRRINGYHPDYVFTYKGKPFTRITNSAWYTACKNAGLSVRAHDLRHTWASRHVQSGTDLYDLQHLGCWSDIRMVQRYAHLSAKRIEQSAHNISGLKAVESDVTSHLRHTS